MTKSFTKVLFLLLTLLPGILYSQTTLIYFEDFVATDTINVVKMNTTGVGANTGTNRWTINNKYVGQPVYPNTISQTQTFGGLITHPDSNYLHIRDFNVNTVSNANFNPNNSSDRFTQLGPFCTLGDSGIHFAFFYLCEGNTNSYGQVYYKADSGPWTLASGTNYKNTSKWKYEDLVNPAFDNVNNLRFGFRWVNGSSTDTTASFALDDIKVVGTYNPDKYPVTIKINQLYNVPVCQNNDILVQITLSAPLCGQGIYQLQLSDAGGDFSSPFNGGNFLLNNDQLTNYLSVHIPSNTPADTCYKIRIIRADITPYIYSDTSICFEVKKCPNTITTLGPIVISKPNDTICVNSVIDIPFLSTGVFVNNKYIAQLSDSDGHFIANINELGTLNSSQTFPGPPGTISGKITVKKQPIPPGCKYYIRVVSTNPVVIGNLYGPFCIRDCDMETNQTIDIHVCITPTVGDSIVIPVDINMFDSTINYGPGNQFKVQLLSPKTFNVVNTGGLGVVFSDSGTLMTVKIPGLTALQGMGLGTGMYYMRVISTTSSAPWNMLGTLIRLTIGSPFPSPVRVLYLDINTYLTYDIRDTNICAGSTMFYQVDDNTYNPGSEYTWTLNNNNNWPGTNDGFEAYTGIIFNGAGEDYLSVIETNNGCEGPGSDTIHISVHGTPSASVNGPPQVCIGDTAIYSVPLENETYYKWTVTAGATILDTANNICTVKFTSVGQQTLNIHVVGLCGTNDGNKTITVRAYPIVNAGNDSTVCKNDTVKLSTTNGAYTYEWSTGATTRQITVYPDTTTKYVITSKVTGTAGCASKDSVTIFVQNPVLTDVIDSICRKQPLLLDPGISGAEYYSWNTGQSSQAITVDSAGTYILTYKIVSSICKAENTYRIAEYTPPGPAPDSALLCTGGAVTLDAGIPGAIYYWSTDANTQTISVNTPGDYFVTIVDNNGECLRSAEYYVRNEDCILQFPNVFSPNKDGKNDKWFNSDSTVFKNFLVKIYDRWGILMFESSDSNFQWDGKNQSGNMVPDGVYYYLVVASNDLKQQELHGFITLVDGQE